MSDWVDVEAEKVGLKLHWEHKSDCAKIAAALRKTRADAVRSFTVAIFHGDDVHRVWLMEAADAFIAGKPMPPPRDATTHKE